MTPGGKDDGDVDPLENLITSGLRESSETIVSEPIADETRSPVRSTAVRKADQLVSSAPSFEPPSKRETKNVDFAQEAPNRFEGRASHVLSSTKSASASKKNTKLQNFKSNNSDVSSSTAETELVATDRNNRFKGLRIETSAPKEEEIELVVPKTAYFVPTKRNATPSLSTTMMDNDPEDFPALLPTSQPVNGNTCSTITTTSKAKVLSIGVAAVRLHEAAKSKPTSKQKRWSSKTLSLGELEMAAAVGDRVDGESKGAWTTVVKTGKRS